MVGKAKQRQRRRGGKVDDTGETAASTVQQAVPPRRTSFELEDGLIVAVCACCVLLDQVGGELLSVHYGAVFSRSGEWVWRGVGALGAAAGYALTGVSDRSALSGHGWSALLWAAAVYSMLLPQLRKLVADSLSGYSPDGNAVASAGLLLGPLFFLLAFYATAQIAHGGALAEVALLAPAITLIAMLLRMVPLPPYPVGVTLHFIALVAGVSALCRLPLRARPAVAVWLLILPFSLWAQSFDHEEFRPDPDLLVHWHGECAAGGFLSVVTAGTAELSFLVMKMDHSLLGGVYATPKEHEGESIYSIFHVQEAVLLVPRQAQPKRSLVVGLGPAVAARGLQMTGQTVDVMELHPEVVHTAKKYFGWEPNGKIWTMDAEAAVTILLRNEGGRLYDNILHDVYSGGALPGHLFSKHFFEKLAALLKVDGVLAVNYYGSVDMNLQRVGRTLSEVFGHARCYGDEMAEVSSVRNFVFFASRRPIRFRRPDESNFFGSSMRFSAFQTFQANEVRLEMADGSHIEGRLHDDGASGYSLDVQTQMEYARSHWTAMRTVMPPSFWSKTF